jgi:DNA repair exonuclease SbcCD ATPase subunit
MATPSFILKSLTLRAFRSVVEEQTLTLPQSGMHLIVGKSGAGKTTIGEGIAFALGYSSISATALQSWDWLTKEPLRAVLEVELPGRGFMRITRGKGASLLMPGEEKPRTSAKAVQEGIVQGLGIDPDFLKVLTYRGQKTPGLFLSMTDSAKKQFLTQLLGLEKFEQAVEKSLANIGALEAQCNTMTTRYETLEQAVGAHPVYIGPKSLDTLHQHFLIVEGEQEKLLKVVAETKALDLELTKQQAETVEAVKAEWEPKVAEARRLTLSIPPVDTAALDALLQGYRNAATTLVGEHRLTCTAVEKELNLARDTYASLKAVADRRVDHEKRLAEEEAHLKKLLEKKCFTCLRVWNEGDSEFAQATERVRAEVEKISKAVTYCHEASAQLPALEKMGLELKTKLTNMRLVDPVPADLKASVEQAVGSIASAKSDREAKVSKANAEYHRILGDSNRAIDSVSRMTAQEEQVRSTLNELNNALTQANANVNSARQGIAFAERENERTETFYREQCQQHAARKATAEKAKKDAETSLAAKNIEQDFLAMVRGFLSYIFDETLSRIADATNARLALIPNVSSVTLRFASERETGTGKLRQEITAVCERDGHMIPIRDGVSGGMFSAIELAVDLSLADVIAERTGVYPGWLILDEAFEGLDDPCKAAVFDMLKAISVDRAVFVVDHAESMKELFDSRIRVDFDGARSTIHAL